VDRIVQNKCSNGRRKSCAVENTKVFLGLQRDRLNIVFRKRFPRRDYLTSTKDRRTMKNANRGIADKSTGNIRQGGKIYSWLSFEHRGKNAKNSPPDDEILPRRGTKGVMLLRSRSPIFSISCHRTPECPRTREFIRTRMAPRTHDSGILVDVRGSRRGSASRILVDEGRMPPCWCWSNACPSARSSLVRVSAVEDRFTFSHKA